MWAQAELRAMVTKAARGAGFAVGQAEDVSRVAVYLLASGGDSGLITAALRAPRVGVEVDWGHEVIHVKRGPAILIGPMVCDAFALGCMRAELADPAQAPLICAYLAQAGVATQVDGAVIVEADGAPDAAKPGPVDVPAGDWAVWETLAAKTYVPETEASRLAGAGAGLTDND